MFNVLDLVVDIGGILIFFNLENLNFVNEIFIKKLLKSFGFVYDECRKIKFGRIINIVYVKV